MGVHLQKKYLNLYNLVFVPTFICHFLINKVVLKTLRPKPNQFLLIVEEKPLVIVTFWAFEVKMNISLEQKSII